MNSLPKTSNQKMPNLIVLDDDWTVGSNIVKEIKRLWYCSARIISVTNEKCDEFECSNAWDDVGDIVKTASEVGMSVILYAQNGSALARLVNKDILSVLTPLFRYWLIDCNLERIRGEQLAQALPYECIPVLMSSDKDVLKDFDIIRELGIKFIPKTDATVVATSANRTFPELEKHKYARNARRIALIKLWKNDGVLAKLSHWDKNDPNDLDDYMMHNHELCFSLRYNQEFLVNLRFLGDTTKEAEDHLAIADWLLGFRGKDLDDPDIWDDFLEGCIDKIGVETSPDDEMEDGRLKYRMRLDLKCLHNWLQQNAKEKEGERIWPIMLEHHSVRVECYRDYVKRIINKMYTGKHVRLVTPFINSDHLNGVKPMIWLSQNECGKALCDKVCEEKRGVGHKTTNLLDNLSAYFDIWIWPNNNAKSGCIAKCEKGWEACEDSVEEIASDFTIIGEKSKLNHEVFLNGLQILMVYREQG